MLMIDMHNSAARISLYEMRMSGGRYCSDDAAFAGFAAGLTMTPGALLEQAWRLPGGAAGGHRYFHAVMHDVVPKIYDAEHLETLGGRFALRIAGVGDYTVTLVNRRVVTLSGLPVALRTGEPAIDAVIGADAFMALFNDMLADVAEAALSRIGAARAAAA